MHWVLAKADEFLRPWSFGPWVLKHLFLMTLAPFLWRGLIALMTEVT